MRKLRRRTWQIVEPAGHGDVYSHVFDVVIIGLILLNVAAAVLETVAAINERFARELVVFEAISVVIFGGEYLLRLWSSAELAGRDASWSQQQQARLRWVVSPMGLVDAVAILPSMFALMGFARFDARMLRVLRLFRLLRLFKLGRYMQTVRTMGQVLGERKDELLMSLVFIGVLLLLSSSAMYYVEHEKQPDVFTSIPTTMWWAIATLTTVGYGDMAPVSPLGRLLGSVIAVLGIGLFALPAGILSAGFSDALQRRRDLMKDAVQQQKRA